MRHAGISLALLLVAAPLAAQTMPDAQGDDAAATQVPSPPAPSPAPARPGQTAETAAGRVGQRQTREAVVKSIAPMARIDARVRNRVQSRIRNRIDRNYDPRANAVSPFEIAEEQARTAGRPPR